MVASFALLWCGAARAQRADAVLVLDDWGVYDATLDRQVDDPSATTGHRTLSSNIHPIERTHVICARLGVHFGVRYHVRNDFPAESLAVSVHTVHPPMMNMHGAMQSDDETTRQIPAHTMWYTGWIFSEPRELIGGEWHIIVKHAGATQIDETFEVRTTCGAVS